MSHRVGRCSSILTWLFWNFFLGGGGLLKIFSKKRVRVKSTTRGKLRKEIWMQDHPGTEPWVGAGGRRSPNAVKYWDGEQLYLVLFFLPPRFSSSSSLLLFLFFPPPLPPLPPPFFFFFFFFFEDRVSLCSPRCPETHSVSQLGLELRNAPASASQVPGSKVFTPMPGCAYSDFNLGSWTLV